MGTGGTPLMHVSSADDEEKHVANEEEAESPLQVRS